MEREREREKRERERERQNLAGRCGTLRSKRTVFPRCTFDTVERNSSHEERQNALAPN